MLVDELGQVALDVPREPDLSVTHRLTCAFDPRGEDARLRLSVGQRHLGLPSLSGGSAAPLGLDKRGSRVYTPSRCGLLRDLELLDANLGLGSPGYELAHLDRSVVAAHSTSVRRRLDHPVP
jgi:hypothetical protein